MLLQTVYKSDNADRKIVTAAVRIIPLCSTLTHLIVVISLAHERIKSSSCDTAALRELHRQMQLDVRLVFVVLKKGRVASWRVFRCCNVLSR